MTWRDLKHLRSAISSLLLLGSLPAYSYIPCPLVAENAEPKQIERDSQNAVAWRAENFLEFDSSLKPDIQTLLARFDADTWKNLLGYAGRYGEDISSYDPKVFGFFRKLPKRLRDDLLIEIRGRYFSSGKMPERDGNYFSSLGAKRSLDLWASELTHSDETMLNAIKSGATAQFAFDRYLFEIQEVIGMPTRSRYDSSEILRIAVAFQDLLRKSDQPFARKFEEGTSIVIGGSFPNGRAAFPGSDIDVIVSEPSNDARLFGRSFKTSYSVQNSVNMAFFSYEKKLSESLRSIDFFPEIPKIENRYKEFSSHLEHEKTMGFIQPVTIYIDANRIELHIHVTGPDGDPRGKTIRKFLIQGVNET